MLLNFKTLRMKSLFFTSFIIFCFTNIIAQDCYVTPYLINGLATTVNDNPGYVSISASTFDYASYVSNDSCGPISFSYSQDVNDTIRTFDCSSDISEIVQIWVTDAYGHQDFGETYILPEKHYCNDSTEHNVSTNDSIAPTGIIFNGVLTNVLPNLNFVAIYASEFNHASYDNLDLSSDLMFAFSDNPNDNYRYFYCQYLDQNIQLVDIYIFDQAGNYSIVKTYMYVNGCGNQQPTDTIPPELVFSIDSLAIEADLQVTTTARQLASASTDSHSPANMILFSFSLNPADSIRTFECEEKGTHSLSVYAIDEVGNVSQSTTELVIYDPINYCLSSISDDGSETPFEIFPIPTKNHITLKWTTDRINAKEVELIDCTGSRVLLVHIDQNDGRLDLNLEGKIQSGIYFIRIYVETGYYIRKILVN